MPLKLKINNVVTSVDLPPDTPLLWALRDTLDLKGAKYGCGIGACGACTVPVGWQPGALLPDLHRVRRQRVPSPPSRAFRPMAPIRFR